MSNQKNEEFDFLALAKALDVMREGLQAMVASVVSDGFTEEQARDIVTGFFRMTGKKNEEQS